MRGRHIAVFVSAGASLAALSAAVPPASAQPCPDVEVVFARGTTEDPGVGPTGQAFVDSVRARLGAKSIGVYPVDYPATIDFPTALTGVRDASTHIEATAASCPNTKMVLGGFSQGAAVMGFVTANVIPDGAPEGVPNPMPPDVANHVAAVALFGKPNARFMGAINQPQIVVGPAYAAKTMDLCVPDDFVCSGGRDFNAHMQYADTGMIDQAATFAAGRVLADSRPAAPTPPQAPVPAAPPAPAAPPPQAPAPAAPPPQSPAQAPPPFDALHPLPPGTLLRCDTVCHVIGPA
ncbi:cutinase family protein [Mycobacterium sp.]|uniref:cutinase family protein n=1 Tax=Mycobacterium sp. TaxID=1785 RepID=UPI002B9500C3|nr:cutinase family protein [Mycobacterium sp.]HKP43367.1 cutinase family protein [Mycobacterium sp.]